VAVGQVLARGYADLAATTCEERVRRIASLATRFHLLPSGQPGGDSDLDGFRNSRLGSRAPLRMSRSGLERNFVRA
jgi:hypothetical protein